MYEGTAACEWLPACVCDCLHTRAGCGMGVDASKKPICVFQVHVHKCGCVWVLVLLLRMSSS